MSKAMVERAALVMAARLLNTTEDAEIQNLAVGLIKAMIKGNHFCCPSWFTLTLQ